MKIPRVVRNNSVVDITLSRLRQLDTYRNLYHERELSNIDRKDIFNKYASYEVLTHWIAYKLANEFNPGSVSYSVIDGDGIARLYNAIQLLTKNKGLMGFILMPDDPTNQNNRMHLIFAGTQNSAGVVRNLEYAGPGGESFLSESQGVLQQLNDMVATLYARTLVKISLSISGHSLGGGDAQNCAAMVIKAMAHNLDEHKFGFFYSNKFHLRCRDKFNLLTELNIAHFNSVGVTDIIARGCDEDARFVSLHGGFRINMHVLRVRDDPIHLSGQSRILANVNARVAKVEMLYVILKNNLEYRPITFLRIFAAAILNTMYSYRKFSDGINRNHCAFHFYDSNDNRMEYHSNKTKIGQEFINSHLTQFMQIDNAYPIQLAKDLISTVIRTLYKL
jgi:hypothetical protein